MKRGIDTLILAAQHKGNRVFSVLLTQGNNENQDYNVINDNNKGNVRTVNTNNVRGGCSYKEFMACNLKDYDGKGGTIVYTRWIEKIKSVQDMSGCGENQKVEYTAGSFIETEFWCHIMVGAGHAAYTDRFHELARAGHVVYTDQFHELARLVPHLVTPKNKKIERYIYGLASHIRAMVAVTEPTTVQSVVLKARMLTDEANRNGSLKKNTKKRGNSTKSSRDGNARDDNMRSRTEKAFATIKIHVRKEYIGMALNAQTTTITNNLKCLVICVQTAIDLGTLPRIVG
nr:hypothetical protein [Tanacetum cinerariifolium]